MKRSLEALGENGVSEMVLQSRLRTFVEEADMEQASSSPPARSTRSSLRATLPPPPATTALAPVLCWRSTRIGTQWITERKRNTCYFPTYSRHMCAQAMASATIDQKDIVRESLYLPLLSRSRPLEREKHSNTCAIKLLA